jgi:nicotinamidase-related amidase
MSKALIVIDIQNDYFENGAWELVGATKASLKAKEIINSFRENNELILHIQHFNTQEGAVFFKPNTKGVEIHENVKPLSTEKIIAKNYPNSFKDTELLTYLKSNNIKELVLVGMMTHMCVDATTRAAKDLGFDCTVISDACASRDVELNAKKVDALDVHTAFLASLAYAYANVITADQYLLSK